MNSFMISLLLAVFFVFGEFNTENMIDKNSDHDRVVSVVQFDESDRIGGDGDPPKPPPAG